MAPPTIVFDLDGTLVDTAPDLIASINHCLGAAGLAAADPLALRPYVGHGGKAMIERCFALQKAQLTQERLTDLLAIFLRHYEDTMPGGSLPYPGVVATLDRFAEAGWALAVCTNKPERLALRLMEKLDLSRRFGAICGADTFAYRKPDPRHLYDTVRRAGGDPMLAVMVGDSRTDVDTAIAAGLPVVAVDFGYTDRPVREFEPSRVISHYDELTVGLADELVAAIGR